MVSMHYSLLFCVCGILSILLKTLCLWILNCIRSCGGGWRLNMYELC